MTDYLDRERDKTFTRVYKQQTPDILQAFVQFDAAVFQPEGRAIPLRYRELIALAVGITTQCVYCIDAHSQRAVAAGATEAELAEAAWVATAIRAGGGFAHGRLGFKFGADATPPEHASQPQTQGQPEPHDHGASQPHQGTNP
ncbi:MULTISPECIES: carboxymuconolactone decarboxylase family protein [unclassified Curtobacterium]|uniref:carboxymuconolactone decarboxylase family protein n=1 Tax=unclassified Curtobacterium TaxID=257496 RepID=UPI0009F69410|nr:MULTISPECIES: carboxymuconolactone decarboxylase family protein [unclassified Curtobacterium]WIB01494.1 carboxymuconolactone decarboxylase family protein [Curtobacterium sp. MCBA15_012]